MSKIEQFGLYTGILGLVADGIALITFFAGLWGNTASQSNGGELPTIVQAVLFLTIIYSWASICWALVRKAFVARRVKKEDLLIEIPIRAIVGVGVLILPIFTMWLIAIWQGDLPTRSEANRRMETQEAVIRLTPTAVPTPVPTLAPNQPSPTRTFSEPLVKDVPDRTDAAWNAIVVAPLLQGVMGFALFWMLHTLMPLVYADMVIEGRKR